MTQTLTQPQKNVEDHPAHPSGRPFPHAPPSEIGHWVRTAGILSPLLIGELVKDPERKWRFIRVSSVAAALISEGLHAHRIQRERREREAHCGR
jgi:hypothetical protein